MGETLPDINAVRAGQTGSSGSSDERGRVSSAARVVAGMTTVSRVAGLARDAAISAVFGTGLGADAFFVAFRIPNLMRRVVAEGATSAAFVPVFTDSLAAGGRPAAIRAAAAVGGAAVLVLAFLTLAGMAASGALTTLFAPGFSGDPAKAALTASLTRWTFPYLLLVGSAAWAMGVHHTFRNFALPAAGPVLMNLSMIAFALGAAPWMEAPAWALVAGVVVGGLAQVLLQLPSLWKYGLRAAMFVDLGHPAVGRCGGLMLAALLGGSVYQVNVLLATVFASVLPAGTVSYLWYADRLFEFPLGIVAVAVGTAALPSLSSQAARRHFDGMGETVVHAMSLTIAFCLPAAVGLMLLAHDITELLFERGSFVAADTAMTAWALQASVPGLLGVGLVRVLSAAFFALERTRVPVAAGLFTMLVNALLSIALMGPGEPGTAWWGAAALASLQAAIGIADLRHAGLALAAALSATANAVILLLLLRRALPRLPLARLGRPLLQHAAAAAAMAGVVLGWIHVASPWSFAGAVAVRVGVGVGLGLASYFVAAIALGSREVKELGSRRVGAAAARVSRS
ncbi:MAG: murein biosynthesis integral membrane protein MurJ [Candidatus Binatia bacterium]